MKMNDDYPEVKPNSVKLESELILEDDVENNINVLETGNHVASETVPEQNSIFPGRESLNVEPSFSTRKTALSVNQDVKNVMVKIKEEMPEDVSSTTGTLLDGRQHFQFATVLLPAFEESLEFREEKINIKVEYDPTEKIDSWKTNQIQPDFNGASKKIAIEEPSADSRQRISPQMNVSPFLKGSLPLPEDRMNIKLEDNLAEESNVSKKNQGIDNQEASKEIRIEGTHFLKTSSTSRSKHKEFQYCKVPHFEHSVFYEARSEAKYFDLLADMPEVHSEVHSELSKFKHGLAHVAVVHTPSLSSMGADGFIKHTTNEAAQNHSKSLPNKQPSVPKHHSAIFYGKNNTNTSEKRFKCNQCLAKFTTKGNLKTHSLTHTNERSFPCNLCSARFKLKGHLRDHLLIHSTERAFSCDQCSARFKLQPALQRHLLIHSNERAFSCNHCSAQFKQKAHLQSHLLIHSNERAFSCNQCPAKFKRKCHLHKHMITH